jgi:hypothetical protein
MRRSLLGGVVVSVWAAAGCGGSSGLSTGLEGIYSITTWTDNPTACDAEGPSVLAMRGDTALFIRTESFLGKAFLNGVRCADLPACRTAYVDATVMFNGWSFEKGGDASGWTGATIYAGSGTGTQCTGKVIDHTMTSPATHQLRIESKSREAMPFAVGSDGFCSTDAAQVAAMGQPCVDLEVVTATFVE